MFLDSRLSSSENDGEGEGGRRTTALRPRDGSKLTDVPIYDS